MTEKVDITFNEDDLTLGDMEDFENYVGQSLLTALEPKPVMGPDGRPLRDEKGRPISEVSITAKALIALVWITKRREDASFTVEQARHIKVGNLNLGGEEADDVAPASAEGKSEPEQNVIVPLG